MSALEADAIGASKKHHAKRSDDLDLELLLNMALPIFVALLSYPNLFLRLDWMGYPTRGAHPTKSLERRLLLQLSFFVSQSA